ncbi:MAG: HNH endonuclease, partial [Caulobacteraceae bacterium]|nr:HNH endonuclease [Caulobacteraceae bacterium]
MITQQEALKLFEYRNGALFYKQRPSQNTFTGDRAGYVDNNGYRKLSIKNKRYQEHRIIFLMHHGYLPDTIDHIDGNPANNRIENLREATQQQNCYNSATHGCNTSGYRGVSWSKVWGKWQAYVNVNKKRKFLGY